MTEGLEAWIGVLSRPGFDPSYGKLICLATLMSSDRTKQICLWMTIYIYIQYTCSFKENDIQKSYYTSRLYVCRLYNGDSYLYLTSYTHALNIKTVFAELQLSGKY